MVLSNNEVGMLKYTGCNNTPSGSKRYTDIDPGNTNSDDQKRQLCSDAKIELYGLLHQGFHESLNDVYNKVDIYVCYGATEGVYSTTVFSEHTPGRYMWEPDVWDGTSGSAGYDGIFSINAR
jgi:hypothetical protein